MSTSTPEPNKSNVISMNDDDGTLSHSMNHEDSSPQTRNTHDHTNNSRRRSSMWFNNNSHSNSNNVDQSHNRNRNDVVLHTSSTRRNSTTSRRNNSLLSTTSSRRNSMDLITNNNHNNNEVIVEDSHSGGGLSNDNRQDKEHHGQKRTINIVQNMISSFFMKSPSSNNKNNTRSIIMQTRKNSMDLTKRRFSMIGGIPKSELRRLSNVNFGTGNVKRLKRHTSNNNNNKNNEHHVHDSAEGQRNNIENLPSLLCLHGWRSNSEISKIHLDNLGITDRFRRTYLNGPFESDMPADDAVGILAAGPYYSWCTQSQHDDPTDLNLDEVIQSLYSLLLHLLLVPDDRVESCYDAVFGFSQAVSFIVLLSIPAVRNRLLQDMGLPPMIREPWKFVIATCGANVRVVKKVLQHFEIPIPSRKINVPSLHIIGIHDPFKLQSEEMYTMFQSKMALPMYLDSGHEVPGLTKRITRLPGEIMDWFGEFNLKFTTLERVEEGLSSKTPLIDMTYEIHKVMTTPIGSVVVEKNVGILRKSVLGQYALNRVDHTHCSLLDMLRDTDESSIALRAPNVPSLSYGDLLKFIHGGEGDLRRIGVAKHDIVAYLAPLGVVSAMAFLTLSSQCTSAPLDPAYSEESFLLAFKQLKPSVVISFDGVDSTQLNSAAVKLNIKVVHARVNQNSCGLFSFDVDVESDDLKSQPCLENDPDRTALILRTSGTTSEPKVCSLKMSSIVLNAKIIAKNLGLQSTDIALNAMPLFHIGGISANLLSSLAVGASVILMRNFDVDLFFEMLTSTKRGMPRPTWFSAVPTMHAAIQQYSETATEDWSTSLRFIRSGAAAMPADLALRMEGTFKCPLILTYSMTEQMPITQPPTGFSIPQHKPNSVGQPVAASICIVDEYFRPIPYDDTGVNNGEICISGPMVLEEYTANPSANASAYFYLGGIKWFRTGDVGHLDREGFLFLTGRSKELIKRGGEQVSPYEVEDACYLHQYIQICVVFAIPSPIWGEQVAAAIVLTEEASREKDPEKVKDDIRSMLLQSGLERHKVPEHIIFVSEDQLLKTRSNKYIRIGLAKHLGVLTGDMSPAKINDMKHVSLSDGAIGLRFVLALAVMYTHIGNFDQWSVDDYLIQNSQDRNKGWSNTRLWCFHTPMFFLVGGFFLAAGTHSPVTNRRDLSNFYALRLASLHPMYLISIILCLLNFLFRCGPSNYINEFERVPEPVDGQTFVCQASSAEMPWSATLVTTVLTYVFGLQSWPFLFPVTWFLSYYTWFSSVYIFCIFVFPWCHRQYFNAKDDIAKLWKILICWMGLLYLYVGVFAFTLLFMYSDQIALQNYWTLSVYLLPLGWLPCFAIGIGLYFFFRHYHPGETKSAWIWGVITDTLSLCLLGGWLFFGLFPKKTVPGFVEIASSKALSTRFFGSFLSRLICPVGFLWFWGIAVGKGVTAKLFSNKIFVIWLAPASYNMFLFHQPIAEWYYFATRGDWWALPKPYYWFSPYAYPVKPWEFPIVITLIIIFSVLMETYVNEMLIRSFAYVLNKITCNVSKVVQGRGQTTEEIVIDTISELTYSDMINRDSILSDAGLGSLTSIVLVGQLKKAITGLRLTARDVASSVTVADLTMLIEGRIQESKVRPDLALTNKTSVFLEESAPEGNVEGSTMQLRKTSLLASMPV